MFSLKISIPILMTRQYFLITEYFFNNNLGNFVLVACWRPQYDQIFTTETESYPLNDAIINESLIRTKKNLVKNSSFQPASLRLQSICIWYIHVYAEDLRRKIYSGIGRYIGRDIIKGQRYKWGNSKVSYKTFLS